MSFAVRECCGRLATGLVASTLVWIMACSNSPPPARTQVLGPRVEPSAQAPAPIEPLPYPPARWRLTSPHALVDVVFWVSHILIRHEGSDQRVAGSVAQWRLDAPPGRPRSEALALAQQIAHEAGANPARFAELAERHSDDITTRLRGGSLGGLRASELMGEPPLLDALAVLRSGEVSRVIETHHGFEILYRRPAPAPARVSGEHIVIGHADTRWLDSVGAPAPARSRDRAFQLASELYERLRADPASFPRMVQLHSEHPDKAMGGDIGSWSVLEPTPHPRSVEVLSGLRVGEIAPPAESYHGFEILRRTPDSERENLAMEAVHVAFNPEDAASKQSALERARELSAMLREQPARFEELQRSICCVGAVRWIGGRDEPGLTQAVSRLAIDEIAAEPVLQYVDVVIPKRVSLDRAPAPRAVSYDLPSPEAIERSWFMALTENEAFRRDLLAGNEAAFDTLGLSAEQRQALSALSDDFDSPLNPNAPNVEAFLSALVPLIGERAAADYEASLERRAAALLLGSASEIAL